MIDEGPKIYCILVVEGSRPLFEAGLYIGEVSNSHPCFDKYIYLYFSMYFILLNFCYFINPLQQVQE